MNKKLNKVLAVLAVLLIFTSAFPLCVFAGGSSDVNAIVTHGEQPQPERTLTIMPVRNGHVIVVAPNPLHDGDTVVFTIFPDAGYSLDAIYLNGINVTADMVGNTYTVIVSKDIVFSAEFKKNGGGSYTPSTPVSNKCKQDLSCPLAKFNDLNPKEWYHDGIHYCLDKELMYGVGNNTFNPSGVTSRAQLVTILWRMSGSPYVNYAISFKDVKQDPFNTWYVEAVRWATSTGIVKGYNKDSFGPKDAITREQFATILYNYAKYLGEDVEKATKNTNTLSYTDIFEISSWASNGMHYCIASKFIQGYNGYLRPQDTTTRAEAASMIQRFCER